MWSRGQVDVVWGSEIKQFPYVRPLLSELPEHTQTEVADWRGLGYTNEHLMGMFYNSKNSMPDWCDTVANAIGLKDCGFCFYKMTTCDILPAHVDHVSTYMKVFNKSRGDIWRAIVFLEEWKPGHYFEIDGQAVVNYSAGEYIIWPIDTPHAAANIGLEDRYTLQITGIKG